MPAGCPSSDSQSLSTTDSINEIRRPKVNRFQTRRSWRLWSRESWLNAVWELMGGIQTTVQVGIGKVARAEVRITVALAGLRPTSISDSACAVVLFMTVVTTGLSRSARKEGRERRSFRTWILLRLASLPLPSLRG